MKDPYALLEERFGSLTDIQKMAFPAIEKGLDCLISAPTGSGKTEAAIIPTLKKIIDTDSSGNVEGICAIYVTPLRALNRDLLSRLEWLSKETGISISVRHGDTSTQERREQVKKAPQFLITTPETLQNILLSGLRPKLKNLRTVIVDEMHELYFNKRGAQLAITLERIREISGEYQRIGISATFADSSEAATFLFPRGDYRNISSGTSKKYSVSVEMPMQPGDKGTKLKAMFAIDQSSIARIERISSLIRESRASILFANTRQVVESLGSKLLYFSREDDFGKVGVHHSSIDREERVIVEDSFKRGEIKCIIATSSLELGIDIGAIDLVMQYGSPRQVVRLIQRIGRAGHREGAVSNGIIIVAGVMECIESSAIISLSESGVLEKRAIERSAADVVANQIAAMALEYGVLDERKAYDIIRRASPYLDMEYGWFRSTLSFLSDNRIINYSEGKISRTGKGRQYFIRNISILPDNKYFRVRNTSSNKIISLLDEKFVYNNIDSGSTFITKGVPWRVITIEEDTIYVEPSAELEAAIPDWEGEDIPVSREVVHACASAFSKPDAIAKSIHERATLKAVKEFISAQNAAFVPDTSEVVIEESENLVMITTYLGTLANQHLSKLISSFARSYMSKEITARVTPYSIVLDISRLRTPPDFAEMLKRIASVRYFESREAITSSEIFRYKFVQVAKTFGVVSKDATITKSAAEKLISFYSGSIIEAEVMRDLSKNYLDASAISEFMEGIMAGRIKIKYIEGKLSPIAAEIASSAYLYKEFLMPNLPTDREIKDFRDRLSGKRVTTICTYCSFESPYGISFDGSTQIKCPNCGSPLLAIYSEEYRKVLSKKRAGSRLSSKESAIYWEMVKESGLIASYGDRAVVALSTYGIGPNTAARVLRMLRKEEDSFIMDLLDAQKKFIKNKKYWA